MELVKTVVSFFGKGEKPVGNSRDSYYFIYPRDKNGLRTGQTIAVLVHEGRMFHGIATCSKEDTFSKATGRELALYRAKLALDKHLARKAQ